MSSEITEDKVRQRMRAKLARFRLKCMQYQLAPRKRIRQLRDYFLKCAVSIVGMLVGAFIYYLWTTGHVPAPQQGTLAGFFIAVGGMIGTMIVLVFTLSIIPIQRSADRFSPFVSQLYRDDLTTHTIFFIMAAFCLFSFALALEGLVPLSGPSLLAIETFVIAVTLDLIRWHQRRVNDLLEPQTAINLLVNRTLADIDVVVKTSSRWAKLHKIANETKITPGFAAADFHEFERVKHSTDNLAWIAHKAVDNVEMNTAALAVNAMARVVSHYLTSLRQNEVIRSSIPSLDSQIVRNGLRPFYEHLKDVSNHAVTRNNETTCIQVILALETIASHAAMFDAQVFGKFDTTNVAIPVGYMDACSANAQRNNMYDAVLEASHALKRFARNWKEHPKSLDIYSILLDNWYKMALGFSLVGKRALVNQIIADMVALAQFLIAQKYFLAKEVFGFILNKLEALVALDVKTHGNLSLLPPLVPYDLMNPLSLFGLLREAVIAGSHGAEGESEETPSQGCGELARFLEPVSHHLRNLADNTNIAASLVFLPTAQLIDAVTKMILEIIGTNDCSQEDRINLLNQVSSLLSFFWASFQTSAKMGEVKHWNALIACNFLAFWGMAFYRAGFREYATDAAGAIASISDSFCQRNRTLHPPDVADLLIQGLQIELAVRAMGDNTVGGEIAELLSCPGSVTPSIRNDILEAFELRKRQLIDELKRSGRRSSFKSTRLLQDILSGRVSGQPTKDPSET